MQTAKEVWSPFWFLQQMRSVLNWNSAIMLCGALWEPKGIYLKTQAFAWPCFYNMHGYNVNAQLFVWVLCKFKNVEKSQRRLMTWPTTHYYLTAFSLTKSVKRRIHREFIVHQEEQVLPASWWEWFKNNATKPKQNSQQMFKSALFWRSAYNNIRTEKQS